MMQITLDQLLEEKARRRQLRAAEVDRSGPRFSGPGLSAPVDDRHRRAVALLNAPKLPGFGGEQKSRRPLIDGAFLQANEDADKSADESSGRRRTVSEKLREEFPECNDAEASGLAKIAATGAGGVAGFAACSASPGVGQTFCAGAGGAAGAEAADWMAQENCTNEAWKAKYCVYKGKKTLKNVGEEGEDIVVDDYDCSSYNDRN